ncbi:unnamed protein product [Symbiodinium pilosum]|uniref:Uncharacterized protein n=1 Tax=Symbiodinium pilosum TaxID=2952 RepID=A0A812KTI7_SYMPI|nr:unnamed protein product [Symbiodinium pilosum]
MVSLLVRLVVLALSVACVQGLDVLGGASTQHKHKHKHHKHHHKEHKALSTAPASPAPPSLPQISLPSQPNPTEPKSTDAGQQELQHIAKQLQSMVAPAEPSTQQGVQLAASAPVPAVPSTQSLAVFDSEAQQALPAIVDDVRKAAAHKAPLDELKQTRSSEVTLLKEQEALLTAGQAGLDKSALQQQVDSTKTMIQSLDSQIASKRQDAVNILGKALSDANTALVQASSEEAAQEAAAKAAEKQIKVAQQQKVNAKKVIEQAQKVMEVFGGLIPPTPRPEVLAVSPSPTPPQASEPQELS